MTERRDLPLFAWGDALRAARATRVRLARRGAIAAGGIALVAATIVAPPRPLLVWNASASAPVGLYAVRPGTAPGRGDMAIAWPPSAARKLADRRHYLPYDVPLVKKVAAIPGDRACASGARITVRGVTIAKRLVRDAAGRRLPWWRGCLVLHDGAVLLVNDAPGSFDGRYFGPTAPGEVIGRATPLWVR